MMLIEHTVLKDPPLSVTCGTSYDFYASRSARCERSEMGTACQRNIIWSLIAPVLL